MIVWVYLHSYFCGAGAPKDVCNVKTPNGCSRSVQGHPRSLILVPIESDYAVSYYIVFNSSLGRILHRFGDTAAVEKSPKSPVRTHPSLRNRPRWG